jgi:hypothetical protein
MLARLGVSAATAGLVAATGVYLRRIPHVAPEPVVVAAPTTKPALAAAPVAQVEDLDLVYRRDIVPYLNDFDHRNEIAAERAMLTLHERMNRHRAGIKPFTKDIVSWGTRFHVVGRYSSDAWLRFSGQPSASSVHAYIDDKFRHHILSQNDLHDDVSAVLAQFNADVAANRNRLYSELALPLSRLKTVHLADAKSLAAFQNDVEQREHAMTVNMGADTVLSGLVSLAGGWVATDMAASITSRIIAEIATQAGVTIVADGIDAGGAMVGSTAVGGSTGSLGGPAGAVIGLGVGLAVGCVVDWYLSDSFETRMAIQCNRFLGSVERHLQEGAGARPGIQQLLREAVRVSGQQQRAAVRAALEDSRT